MIGIQRRKESIKRSLADLIKNFSMDLEKQGTAVITILLDFGDR